MNQSKLITKAKETFHILLKQISLIIVSFIFATIFLSISNYDPFAVLKGIGQAMTSDLAGTIRWATPLILSGLAICVTFKANVFNLGLDGQIYLGAAAATAVALILPQVNGAVSLTIIFIAAMLAGAVMAIIPALLKVFFNTDEVVSTLLLNFIAALYIEYLVAGPMRDETVITKLNASKILPEWTWLPRLEVFSPSPTNVGIYMAIIGAVLIGFLFYKTKLGFEIKIVGENPTLATYSGMVPKSTTVSVMAISGAIGGIIGAIEVTAVQHRLIAGFNPGLGFDGIVVSLLANNNPVGVIFSGFFFGGLRNGGINMERMSDVPAAVTQIVMAIIILTISAQIVLPKVWKRWKLHKQIHEVDVQQNEVRGGTQ